MRNSPPQPDLDALRSAMLQLHPTGAAGFEGLLAVVLEKIAKLPFRLAKSGLQNGIDGDTLSGPPHVSFEGKLYTGKIPDDEVLTKIARLAGAANPPDLWVLGATVGAAPQLLGPAQVTAARAGFSILVLDWPTPTAYPPLAVACAMAEEETGRFLKAHLGDPAIVAEANAALRGLLALEDFEAHASGIAARVRVASLSLLTATSANEAWLLAALSDRATARAVFGQVMSPRADAPMQHRARTALTNVLKGELFAAPSRRIIAVIGGEGRGKSWLAADAWLSLCPRILALFIPAADLKSVAAYGDFTSLLIKMILQQTDDADTEENRRRWERRLETWKAEPTPDAARFMVVVDGLNEQPRFDWQRWLEDAAAKVEQLGGALIVTARQAFYEDRLRRSLNTPLRLVEVPEWTTGELNEILEERGIDPGTLAPTVYDRLRNPRILAIAFSLLRNDRIQEFAELSVERLLFEHIRASESAGSPPEPPQAFASRLGRHAQSVIDRVRAQQVEDRLVFDPREGSSEPYVLTNDLLAVTAEHFFHPLSDEPALYTLSDDGLSLALGLAVVAALKAAERNRRDVAQALANLLEPVAALDMTAEAMFSALMVSSVDERCSSRIKQALLIGFVGLQNVDERLYPPFVNVVRNAPAEAMASLEELTTRVRHLANRDWVLAALRDVRDVETCRPAFASGINQWLRRYSLDATLQIFSRRADDPDKFEAEKVERQEKLQQCIDALSEAESDFVAARMSLVDSDPAPLQEAAFQLLAGRPLAPFAEALVACAYSLALNSSFHAPHDEFAALIRFNRQDWSEVVQAMEAAAAFLRLEGVSRTGQWALVQLLRAWSRETDGWESRSLVEALTADREKFQGWRLLEDWFSADPCDPASTTPDNAAATAAKYGSIDVGELTKGRWMGSDDHFLRDARPGMARFAPDVAIAKHREQATAALARNGEAQRLGITCFDQHSSLLDEELVQAFLDTGRQLSSPRAPECPQSREAWIGSQYAILIAFPHLSGDQQLDYLASLPPHGSPLLNSPRWYGRRSQPNSRTSWKKPSRQTIRTACWRP